MPRFPRYDVQRRYPRGMAASHLVELRLTSFKSFRGAVLRLRPTTILIGRNSAGKSNALDGLEVLSRLAGGEDIGDALDGKRREGGAIRGLSTGCAPHGEDSFALGCSVELEGDRYDWDVEVEVRPDLRIVSERLHGPAYALKSGVSVPGALFETRPAGRAGTGIEAEIHNGKRGPNPASTFRDGRAIITQIPLAVMGKNNAEASVLRGADAVLAALRAVFHLDPIPHLMRDFVPSRDADLQRTASNLSAALARLSTMDADAFEQLTRLVGFVADTDVHTIDFARSDLGDVMIMVEEGTGAAAATRTSARAMSDGLLRFTAIATALLTARHGLDVDDTDPLFGRDITAIDERTEGGVLVVIEELENGLHPSQARLMLELVRAAEDSGAGTLVTTHSPALLDAAEGDLVENVVVCHRSVATGESQLTDLIDLPGYARALAEGSLGSAVTAGKLVDDVVDRRGHYAEFADLVGL